MTRAVILTVAYVATVWAANKLTDVFHVHEIWGTADLLGFGLIVPWGTYTAGLALIIRDLLHETGGRRWVAGGIAVGTLVSAFNTSPALALASGVAFAVSELADWGVYSRLRERSVLAAVLVSGAVGAPIDSALFLWLSPLDLTWQAMAGQVLVKVVILAPLAWLAAREVKRAVSRQRQLALGA